MELLSQRLTSGHSVALVGAAARRAAMPLLLELGSPLVRVRCGDTRLLGCLVDAARQVDRLVGPGAHLAPGPRRASPVQRLLGEAGQGAAGALLSSLDRLADAGPTPILLFEGVEFADEGSLELLTRVAEAPESLRPTVVLAFHDAPRHPLARTLLRAIRETEGDEAVLAGVEHSPEPARVQGAEQPAAHAPDPAALPASTRRVLRAASLMGARSEAGLLAALLGESRLAILEQLQEAHDQGVALTDLGRGRFQLDESWAQALRSGLLPSLADAWNERLAELLREGTNAGPPSDVSARRDPPEPSPPDEPEERRDEPASIDPTPAPVQPDEPAPVETTGDAPQHAPPPGDAAQAARHLLALGRREEAAAQLIEAADHALGLDALRPAQGYLREALAALGRRPGTRPRRRLAARAHQLLGRLYHRGAGLPDARSTLEKALALLPEGDELRRERAAIRADLAAVCYDLGDPAALERALAELTEAGRELMAADAPVEAARLLNDQAAVWIRLGDPVRAYHLLEESRRVFDPERPGHLPELAETEHLIARMPFHVRAREGRRDDALARAEEHASAAELLYQKIGDARGAARVRTTRAELALARGRIEHARPQLEETLEAQRRLGDVLGLARSACVMAQLLGREGRHREALQLLGEATQLDLSLGTPAGLEQIRGALAELRENLPENAPQLAAEARRLDRQLAHTIERLARWSARSTRPREPRR